VAVALDGAGCAHGFPRHAFEHNRRGLGLSLQAIHYVGEAIRQQASVFRRMMMQNANHSDIVEETGL